MSEKPNHRHLYKRTSISGSSDDRRRRRIAINETLRKKHREQLITAKRYQHLTRREEQSAEDIDPYYRLNTAQIQSLAQDLKSPDKKIRMDAIRYLGKFVVEPAEALITYIVEGNCIDTLMVNLTLIMDIAAGPYDLWIKSISMVPYLINLLDSDNAILREMAAGALGNMAAEDLGDMTTEDDEVRARIRDNGAILPLEPRTIQYACFALANLARGDEAALHPFLASGIVKRLLHHLERETADTITEIAWVMSYLTAGSKEFRECVMQEGFIQPLIKNLNKLADQGVMVIPILRTFGNLAGGPDENIELLVQQERFLPTVLKLAKSDISKRTYIIEQVNSPETIQQLSELVQIGHFDTRKGAAICILNIAHHGQKYMDSLNHRSLVKAFLDFIKSQDAELIRLGLSYMEMLLTRVTKGREILDDTPSCMDALASVNPAPDPQLYAFANQIVDQYYDEKVDDQPAMDEE
ncbi:armadillo-type protein [Absidia repens]|uniref:Armadillo-type protein n=1 Tax=Absidia repens TaxID=90262 RepID=A0A1X2I6E8_9FUNG|nr:armadillo-type protein [Absidia repens]